MYVSQSSDNKVDVTVGDTAVIAKFIGRKEDLDMMVIPEGVDCNFTMIEADNCRIASSDGGNEFTRTCKVTPQMLDDGGERTFIGPNSDILARVYVNGKLHQAVIDMLVLLSSSSGVQVLVR